MIKQRMADQMVWGFTEDERDDRNICQTFQVSFNTVRLDKQEAKSVNVLLLEKEKALVNAIFSCCSGWFALKQNDEVSLEWTSVYCPYMFTSQSDK